MCHGTSLLCFASHSGRRLFVCRRRVSLAIGPRIDVAGPPGHESGHWPTGQVQLHWAVRMALEDVESPVTIGSALDSDHKTGHVVQPTGSSGFPVWHGASRCHTTLAPKRARSLAQANPPRSSRTSLSTSCASRRPQRRLLVDPEPPLERRSFGRKSSAGRGRAFRARPSQARRLQVSGSSSEPTTTLRGSARAPRPISSISAAESVECVVRVQQRRSCRTTVGWLTLIGFAGYTGSAAAIAALRCPLSNRAHKRRLWTPAAHNA